MQRSWIDISQNIYIYIYKWATSTWKEVQYPEALEKCKPNHEIPFHTFEDYYKDLYFDRNAKRKIEGEVNR